MCKLCLKEKDKKKKKKTLVLVQCDVKYDYDEIDYTIKTYMQELVKWSLSRDSQNWPVEEKQNLLVENFGGWSMDWQMINIQNFGFFLFFIFVFMYLSSILF